MATNKQNSSLSMTMIISAVVSTLCWARSVHPRRYRHLHRRHNGGGRQQASPVDRRTAQVHLPVRVVLLPHCHLLHLIRTDRGTVRLPLHIAVPAGVPQRAGTTQHRRAEWRTTAAQQMWRHGGSEISRQLSQQLPVAQFRFRLRILGRFRQRSRRTGYPVGQLRRRAAITWSVTCRGQLAFSAQ